MSGHPNDIHRQGFRFRTGVLAELQDDGQTFSCEAQNISRSGVLLVGEIPVPSAETVDFCISSPSGNLTVRLAGRVIRVHPDPSGSGLQLALEFVAMDDAKRNELEILLARIMEAPPAGPFEALKPGATPQEIRSTLESIPLTQRIGLASRAGLKEREFLRADIHPAVLDSLAHNPQLGIVEARALAGSTYLTPGTLDALSNDPRFRTDEDLRMAIALNPRAILGTAERVTADFKLPQLKKLLAKPGLNQILREKLLRRTR